MKQVSGNWVKGFKIIQLLKYKNVLGNVERVFPVVQWMFLWVQEPMSNYTFAYRNIYPCKSTMWWYLPVKMRIFPGYVSLPEGMYICYIYDTPCTICTIPFGFASRGTIERPLAWSLGLESCDIVDGRNPANQLVDSLSMFIPLFAGFVGAAFFSIKGMIVHFFEM